MQIKIYNYLDEWICHANFHYGLSVSLDYLRRTDPRTTLYNVVSIVYQCYFLLQALKSHCAYGICFS